MKTIKGLYKLKYVLLFITILFLFYPALSNFYTHDDFFQFRISDAHSLKDFILFFDPIHAPEGWGFYRPLTTQVLYFLVRNLFNFDPLAAHSLALAMFLLVCYLVYKLLLQFTNDKKRSYIGLFLYATSASHFTHLYSIANQELGHAIFFLISVITFINYMICAEKKYILFSLLAFVGALMSKELAVTLPVILVIVYVFIRLQKKVKLDLKELIRLVSPFYALLAIYGYLHVFHYGLIGGDSYVWSFSASTALNSLVWYALWSMNIPKMLLDFIGPGLNINPKLMLYWSDHITPIFILFSGFCVITFSMIIITLKRKSRQDLILFLFSITWFVLLLLPVIFLQWHKFWEYLTLPLIGIVLVLSQLIVKTQDYLKSKKYLFISKALPLIFIFVFVVQSKLTFNLAYETEWTTAGARTARRVYDHINDLYPDKNIPPVSIVFYDTPEDIDLPWKPSEQLKVILSDNNFFEVFYEGKIIAVYSYTSDVLENENVIMLPARKFLGY